MTPIETMKLALRALEDFQKYTIGVMIPTTRNQGREAWDNLYTTIVEVENEVPVAYVHYEVGCPPHFIPVIAGKPTNNTEGYYPLYLHNDLC